MYSQFKTDANLESGGVVFDYGDFRVTLARAGGANKRYAKVLEKKTRPYRRAIDTETLAPEIARKIMAEVFAETIVLNWEVRKVDEKGKETWSKGIEGPDGNTIPFSVPNLISTFENLPELFLDIQAQANKSSIYREDITEAASGN